MKDFLYNGVRSVITRTVKEGESVGYWRFVKQSDVANQVVHTGANTDIVYGVSNSLNCNVAMQKHESEIGKGTTVQVTLSGTGVCVETGDNTIVAGDWVEAGADGKAVKSASAGTGYHVMDLYKQEILNYNTGVKTEVNCVAIELIRK